MKKKMDTPTFIHGVARATEENCISKRDSLKREERMRESSHKIFSVATWGSSWRDGFVFTVMAENEVWAEEMVRQWLVFNGKKNHRIDKVMALVSQDVRAIVNVGAILSDF
jgi:hypothetical protein